MPQLGEEPLLLDCTVEQKSNADRMPTPDSSAAKGFLCHSCLLRPMHEQGGKRSVQGQSYQVPQPGLNPGHPVF